MALDPIQNPYQQQPASDTAAERAASAKRLKSAWTSMLVSIAFSVLLLVYVVWRVIYTYSNPALRGNSSALLVIALIILARVAYSGYRLFNRWKVLKAAQDHHRSLG